MRGSERCSWRDTRVSKVGVQCGRCRRRRDGAYLEVLVGLLLPLLGHGLGGLAAERADGGEDAEGGHEDEAGVEEEALALTGGVESAGAVGAEGDPVGCERSG